MKHATDALPSDDVASVGDVISVSHGRSTLDRMLSPASAIFANMMYVHANEQLVACFGAATGHLMLVGIEPIHLRCSGCGLEWLPHVSSDGHNRASGLGATI